MTMWRKGGRSGPYGHYKPKPLRYTEADIQTLQLISEGYSHKEIAEKVYITVKSVGTRVCRVCDKLGARNSPHAVAIGIHKGIINTEQLGN